MTAGGAVTGSYSPYFFVYNDRTMAGGREFHGQPKCMAEVGLEGYYWVDDSSVVGGVVLHDYEAERSTQP